MNMSSRRLLKTLAVGLVAVGSYALLSGCAVSVPKGIQPVGNFDAKRYMGAWYELARIDHRFEKGLINTSAFYSLNEDGSVKVLNRGFDPVKGAWKESEGKAKFLGDPKVASLKVSFFGPFYGGYNVIHLDDDYQTALVVGDDPKYFWLLSRTKVIAQERFDDLLKKAQAAGVDLNSVMAVEQQ